MLDLANLGDIDREDVGCGINATTLHYDQNAGTCNDGELVVVKVVTFFPANAGGPTPTINATVLVFDGSNYFLFFDGSVSGVPAVVGVPDEKYGVSPARYDETILPKDTVRHVGEAVSAVFAVDRRTAMRAAELVEVEYEPLEPVFEPDAALAEGKLWRAKEILQGNLGTRGYDLELYERLGQVLLEMGDTTRLILMAREAVQRNKPDGRRGMVYSDFNIV